MCGICGKVSLGADHVDRQGLERMAAALVHRGPDAEGIHVEGRAGLAQRRLSIIDLSRDGTAPLSNEDGTIWVTLNGEIYNFQDLRRALEARGHRFRTRTDTEVLVHLYEEHDTGFVHHLRGMFAVAIWDSRRERLVAARDRLGKKPFFYASTSRGFVFASSIAALLRDEDVSAAPDYAAIDDFLTLQFVPSPRTAFEGIEKLPAAHLLTCEADGRIEVQRYWQPPLATYRSGAADATELERELIVQLEEAVKLRMVADVPIGAFLSGGVDSSAVVALMTRNSSRPVQTFSIGFDEQEFSELPYARATAAQFGTDHHEFVVRPDGAAILPDLVRHYGEPFADPSALPTYYLAKLTRRHVTVALSGDGGDESFAGYENYRLVSAWGKADAMPPMLRTAIGAAARGASGLLPYHPVLDKGYRAAAMVAGDPRERFHLQTSVWKPGERAAAYTPAFRSRIAAARTRGCRPADLPFTPGAAPLDWMMWHDLQAYLPDCLMVKVDVASMASSLEVRSPLLDHRFVEFAASIPSGLKRDASGGKLILKRALARLLPAETLRRPKQGFGVPLRHWFRGDLAELMRGTLLDDRALARGLFQPAFVRRMVDDQHGGRHDWSHRLWALLCLELWFREFVD